MGNCLVIQGGRKEIKIMRMDGEVQLKLPSAPPLKLAELPPGHAAATAGDALPEPDVAVGRLYHLFPAKSPAAADPGVVRVKLVVSKQELKRMLEKEALSLDDMASLVRKEACSVGDGDGDGEQECCRSAWQPALASIPEGSDLC